MGIECGVLAKMGWTASADVFGPKGFFDTFWPGRLETRIADQGFGAPCAWSSPASGSRRFPAITSPTAPIDAALAAARGVRHRAGPDRPRRDDLPALRLREPTAAATGLDGKFSVQYTTLVALLDGEATIESFTNERLAAPDIAALLPKVELRMDDAIPLDRLKMHVIVDVRLKDGRQLSKRVDRLLGEAGNPLTRDQRLKKFFSCTRRVLEEKAAVRMLELVEQLERLPDITEVMDIARCDRGAN